MLEGAGRRREEGGGEEKGERGEEERGGEEEGKNRRGEEWRRVISWMVENWFSKLGMDWRGKERRLSSGKCMSLCKVSSSSSSSSSSSLLK